ncbi:hypothetical protein [Pseudonocardia sp.]|uniref:hypothetical protein n=1 Tax=Pseudonocardia sp. TaxID=60912 RepID=UPI003D0BF74D
MLKKAGTVVAVATAGLLALSPLAFAGGNVDVTDQENEQESAQGNGILNGNNLVSGNAVQVCGVNVAALNGILVQVPIVGAALAEATSTTAQGGGDCSNAGTAVGQSTTQDAENDND